MEAVGIYICVCVKPTRFQNAHKSNTMTWCSSVPGKIVGSRMETYSSTSKFRSHWAWFFALYKQSACAISCKRSWWAWPTRKAHRHNSIGRKCSSSKCVTFKVENWSFASIDDRLTGLTDYIICTRLYLSKLGSKNLCPNGPKKVMATGTALETSWNIHLHNWWIRFTFHNDSRSSLSHVCHMGIVLIFHGDHVYYMYDMILDDYGKRHKVPNVSFQ